MRLKIQKDAPFLGNGSTSTDTEHPSYDPSKGGLTGEL